MAEHDELEDETKLWTIQIPGTGETFQSYGSTYADAYNNMIDSSELTNSQVHALMGMKAQAENLSRFAQDDMARNPAAGKLWNSPEKLGSMMAEAAQAQQSGADPDEVYRQHRERALLSPDPPGVDPMAGVPPGPRGNPSWGSHAAPDRNPAFFPGSGEPKTLSQETGTQIQHRDRADGTRASLPITDYISDHVNNPEGRGWQSEISGEQQNLREKLVAHSRYLSDEDKRAEIEKIRQLPPAERF